jgi:hypothetical protein
MGGVNWPNSRVYIFQIHRLHKHLAQNFLVHRLLQRIYISLVQLSQIGLYRALRQGWRTVKRTRHNTSYMAPCRRSMRSLSVAKSGSRRSYKISHSFFCQKQTKSRDLFSSHLKHQQERGSNCSL